MKGIKKGDRVRDISVTRRFGTITSVNHYGDPDCLVVRFDDDEESVCYVKDLDIYPGPKTAFLTELQALLDKYDMTIGTFEGCTVPTMLYGIMFGSRCQDRGDIYVFYDMPVISSDDIFNYEKE